MSFKTDIIVSRVGRPYVVIWDTTLRKVLATNLEDGRFTGAIDGYAGINLEEMLHWNNKQISDWGQVYYDNLLTLYHDTVNEIKEQYEQDHRR